MEIWALIMPMVKLALYIGIFLAAGGHLFLLVFGGDVPAQIQASLRRVIRIIVLVAIALVVLFLLVMSGNLGGELSSAIDPFMLGLVMDSRAGAAIILQLTGLILLFMGNILPRKAIGLPRKYGWFTLADLSGGLGVVVIIFAFTRVGHATTNAPLLQFLLGLHLFGIVFWLGALWPLWRLCRDDVHLTSLARIAHRFGRYALVLVGGLLASGMAYGYFLIGTLSLLFGTAYGQFLLAKIALVVAMLGLAAINKFRLVPRLLAGDEAARIELALSIKYEAVIGLAILTITSALTTSLALPKLPV